VVAEGLRDQAFPRFAVRNAWYRSLSDPFYPSPATELHVVYEGIVAVGLLTRRDLDVLGPTFDRVWPVEDAPAFSQLLRAIDEADCEIRRDRDPEEL
jgi:hypothetical protein